MWRTRRVTPATTVHSCHDRWVTDVLQHKAQVAAARPSARSDPAASVWIRGAFAALWAATVGIAGLIVLALVVWAADSQVGTSAGSAMRLAAQLWLLAHRTPLRVPAGTLTIPPLGLTIVLGMLLARASSIVARGSRCAVPRDLGVVIASVTIPYAVIAAVLAAATRSASIRPSAGAAFVCAALIGGGFVSLGAARGAGLTRTVWRSLPLDLRTSLHAAGAAAAVLVGMATLLVLGSSLAHVHHFATIASGYRGGPGVFSMLLLSLLLVPNAIVFAIGYLAGPGFAVGAGSSVALGASHLGATPALPLVAALPSGRAPLPVLVCCVLAVWAAGTLAGWRITRRSTLQLRGQVNSAVVAGAALGIGVALLVGFAGGPAGPGRLRAVGPSPWQVGLAVAGETAVVAVIVVLVVGLASRRSTPTVVTLP
jgi:hypothetical protein